LVGWLEVGGGVHHRQSNLKVMMVQLPAVNTPQFSWVLNG
jgi:hypothetical protein